MNETGKQANFCAEAVPSLISRLEKASGPDRELDYGIWPIANPDRPLIECDAEGVHPENAAYWFDVPRYTSSIDAALTLVPEGGSWVAHGPWKDGSYCAGVSLTPEGAWDDDTSGSTPAIALCIAALKARSAA